MDIAGKVFIVTGGASGLGEGTARMLASNAGKVIIADLQVDRGEAVAKELGGRFVKCDVSQEADGQAVIAAATAAGKLMGLVNCAGIAPAAKTVGKEGAHALSLFSKVVTVNLIGSFNMIRLAAEAMCRNAPEPTGERGVLISTASGRAVPYGLWYIEERGQLFIPPGVDVYEGMIIGENARANDLDVNVTKEKKQTNMRASTADEAVRLIPPRKLGLEQAIEFINDDELVEVTPNHIRLRKRILSANMRPKRAE